ncbi:MAG: hypothetical protein K6B72_07575 [Lachnospiraceae bacterium]|nr:hypothetical protein [Lachnospiraceae bacterium]
MKKTKNNTNRATRRAKQKKTGAKTARQQARTHLNAEELLIRIGQKDGVVSAELICLLGRCPADPTLVSRLHTEGIRIDPSPVTFDLGFDNLSMHDEYVMLLRLKADPHDENMISVLWAHYGKFVNGIIAGLNINNDEEWFKSLGMEFLYESALDHDVMTGNRFASYARTCVRGKLLKTLNKNFLVRIPEDVQIELARVLKYLSANDSIEIKKHQLPRHNWCLEELSRVSDDLEISVKELERLLSLIPLRMIEPLEERFERDEGDGDDFLDKSSDLWDRAVDLEAEYIEQEERESLWSQISELPQEERIAMAYHLGYIDGEEWACSAIAKEMTSILHRRITTQNVKDYIEQACGSFHR